MATSEMIDRACKTDRELHKPALSNPVASNNVVGDVEEEADPFEQALAARWLRRERPAGWRVIAEVLGLEPGKPLTPWPADPSDAVVAAVCLGEAGADRILVEAAQQVVEPAPEPPPAPPQPSTRPRPRQPRPDWNWSDSALCRGEDLVLFFGPDGERQPERDIRERKAKAICAQCPVAGPCLDYALARPEKYGIWQLNEDERASERRRRMRRGTLPESATNSISKPADRKRCSTCQQERLVEDFYRDARTSDRLTYSCRYCVLASKLRQRLTRQAEMPKAVKAREKQCRSCGVIQPAAEFTAHSRSKDGLVANCNGCAKHARAVA